MRRGEGTLNPAHLGHLPLSVVVGETDCCLVAAIRTRWLGLVLPPAEAQEPGWIRWDLFPP